MTDSSVEDEKRALRRAMRGRTERVAPALRDQVAERLARLVADHPAQVVALYAALPDEPPTRPAFEAARARGARVVYPRVRQRLELALVSTEAELVAGYRGIPEPGPHCAVVEVSEVGLFCVPGVCFDRFGGRLGRGGGHYDRLLAEARPEAERVGVCFDEQIVGSVPCTERDATMHVLVTPTETRRVR